MRFYEPSGSLVSRYFTMRKLLAAYADSIKIVLGLILAFKTGVEKCGQPFEIVQALLGTDVIFVIARRTERSDADNARHRDALPRIEKDMPIQQALIGALRSR